MAYTTTITSPEPDRSVIDATPGVQVLEFGTPWCGFCRNAQPLIAGAFEARSDVAHLKIEDGSGRKLGRSFRIKLWPTLVFLRDGVEVARLVRPESQAQIDQAFTQLAR